MTTDLVPWVDERLLCRCTIRCSERATQEDGLCDLCREASKTNHGVGHAHIGEPGAPSGSRMRPVTGTWGMSFEFNVGLG